MTATARRLTILSIASTAMLIRVAPAMADVAIEPTLPEKATEILQSAGETTTTSTVWPVVILGLVLLVVLVAAAALITWAVLRLRRSRDSGSSTSEGSGS